MSDTYVLVHGAWHTGAHLEPTAQAIRSAGHECHCPTLAGNRPGDNRSEVTLEEAVQSLVDYIVDNDLRDVRLMGHSYGGMVIAQAIDRIPERIRRLVFFNAFVPLNGECLLDMVPPHYAAQFEEAAAQNGQEVTLPFPVWREAFINDASFEQAKATYDDLNPHPYLTFTTRVTLKSQLAEMDVGKSYVNCQQDTALPSTHAWHPRLSQRLGLFRLVECPGSHELLFTDPRRFAQAIVEAGRD